MDNMLRLTSPMMHGPAVRRLQELGDLLGYDLGPNDGIFGPDTEAVVLTIQRHAGIKVDGICGPVTWGCLLSEIDQMDTKGRDDRFYDIRLKHRRPKLYKCQRLAQEVHGVTLHQTGCNMPSSPMGWRRLNAHIGVTQEGKIILVNDPLDWIWHAQGLSRWTIGVEIEGNYHGLKGDDETLWKGGGGPHYLNYAMTTALGVFFDWLKEWFDANEIRWNHVYGHRQSASSRIADPGQEIWETIALPWMGKLRNDEGGPNHCRGTGRPIPDEWANDGRQARYF